MPIATILRSEKDTVRPRTHTHITAPASSAGKRFTTGLTERRTTGTARGAAERAHNVERIRTWDKHVRMWEPVPAELLFPHLGTAFTAIRGRRPSTRTIITVTVLAAGVTYIRAVTERRTTGTARGAAGPALNAERIHTWDNPARVEEPAPAELPVRRWGITFTGSRRPKLSTRIIITRTAPAAGSTSERGAMEQGSTATELEKRVRNAR